MAEEKKFKDEVERLVSRFSRLTALLLVANGKKLIKEKNYILTS